nr:hypothetical protein [Tanacetum cinerariifolium]
MSFVDEHDNAVVNDDDDDDDDKIIAYFKKRKKLTLESEDYQQTLQFMYNLRVVERHAKAAVKWQWVKEGRTCGFCELPVPSLQLFWLFGLGVANIYRFFFSAYPATGSFSMSAIENGVKLVYLELSWVLSSAQLSYSRHHCLNIYLRSAFLLLL